MVTRRVPRAKRDEDPAEVLVGDRLRYSTSLVTQGDVKFYTLTMPSDILANCCFATSREEDPQIGFQRVLDEKRAQEIADYMDLGFGTIPSSIVLSAQAEANLQFVGGGKTLEFSYDPHAFLIIDGQHRVFGFSKARTKLRVPVVIYNGLTKQQESRLFIDVNTKQRPVPTELLLDLKKLADLENDEEGLLRELFDAFGGDNDSPLLGLTSPAAKAKGKISRVTFNNAVRPVLSAFASRSGSVIYPALNSYLRAVNRGLVSSGVREALITPTVFRAFFEIFPDVAQRVMDRSGTSFAEASFVEVLSPLFDKMKAAKFKSPPKSHKELAGDMQKALKTGFLIG